MATRIDPRSLTIPVDAAATGNLTLSGAQTVDGVALTAGMLCFARAQSTSTDRALYVVQAGAWVLATPAFSLGLQILVKNGSANGGKIYRITNDITWGAGTPTIVEDASATGPSGSLTNGLTLSGATPTPAADSVVYGVADINGATTAAEQKGYEGGAFMTHRLNGAGTLIKLDISESVADDGTISLPAPTAGRIGVLELFGSPEYGSAFIASDASVTLTTLVSTNFVATDTDTKLCVFDGGSTATIRNRLGSTKWLIGSYRWA